MERHYGADTVLEGLPRQLRWSASTWSAAPGRCTGAAASSTRPSRRPACRCSSRRSPTDDGRLLVDGGVLDNLPTDLLVERDEGPVVAVTIGSGGDGPAPARAARGCPGLGDTLMRTMMIGSGGAGEAARARGAWVVGPSSMGVGLLEFHQLDRMVQAGRAAARALLEQASGDLGRVACPGPGADDRSEPDAAATEAA